MPRTKHAVLTEKQLRHGRLFIVGDVHGCFDELVELLDQNNVGSDDHLIMVGDLVNKGPKSQQVILQVNAAMQLVIDFIHFRST